MRLAISTFKSEVDHWWKAVESILTAEKDSITWNRFLAKFNKNYFTPFMGNQRGMDFLSPTQENSPIAKYEAK